MQNLQRIAARYVMIVILGTVNSQIHCLN